MKKFLCLFFAALLCTACLCLYSCGDDGRFDDKRGEEITRDFAENRAAAALQIYNYYKAVPLSHAAEYDEDGYALVTDEKINTLDALLAETSKYYTDAFIEANFPELSSDQPLYKEKDGRLFVFVDGAAADYRTDFDPESFSYLSYDETNGLVRFSLKASINESSKVSFTYIWSLKEEDGEYKIDIFRFFTDSLVEESVTTDTVTD